MNIFERAVQIWPILSLCAMKRQILTYDQLARLIGTIRPNVGQLLGPIQSYCILYDLPALTSIVVGANSGVPGERFIASADVPEAQAEVFNRDWLELKTPKVEDFEDAEQRLPSAGRSRQELIEQVKNL